MSALQPLWAVDRRGRVAPEPPRAPEVSRAKSTHLMVIGLVPFILAVHYVWGRAEFTAGTRIYAGLIGCAAMASLVYARKYVIPVLGLFLARFYIMIGAPVFSEPRLVGHRGPIRILPESYERGALGCVLFVALVFVTCGVVAPAGKRVADFWSERFGSPSADQRARETFVSRLVVAVSVVASSLLNLWPSAVPGPLSLFAYLLGSPAVSLCLLLWDAEHRSGRFGWMLFWGVLVYQCLLGLASGYLGEALLPVFSATALFWMLRARMPWQLIVGGALVFAVVNPIKLVYRSLSWNTGRDLTVQERIENWQTAFTSVYIDTATPFTVGMGVENAASRLSALPQIAHMFDSVPRLVPHSGPGPWLSVPTFYVPTLLWPERPSYIWAYNKDYGLVFDLQTPRGVRTTTLNLPCVGDGYWRLGWTGVAIEGLLMGLLLGFLQGLAMNRSREAVLVALAYVVALKPEAHVFAAVSSLPQFVVFIGMLLFALYLPRVVGRR